jgi:hypothetical protein
MHVDAALLGVDDACGSPDSRRARRRWPEELLEEELRPLP